MHPWLWFIGRSSDCRTFTSGNIGDNGGEAPNTAPNIDAALIDQQHPNTMTPAGAPAP